MCNLLVFKPVLGPKVGQIGSIFWLWMTFSSTVTDTRWYRGVFAAKMLNFYFADMRLQCIVYHESSKWKTLCKNHGEIWEGGLLKLDTACRLPRANIFLNRHFLSLYIQSVFIVVKYVPLYSGKNWFYSIKTVSEPRALYMCMCICLSWSVLIWCLPQ